ncbi:PspC domain-containing protein [Microbacterium sp. cf332]|uniref:PspC domain-containing protein n=1 Tax=Microbacterium sp. cf332 TaxID=1761804 RepID=UPI00088F42E4|nr:PspC domain-containing protein [Microbacterium sp. cf332]SDQ07987.1 phage shock protein C (PspC) family protein [Microbacterium sp. cf332]
MSDIQHMRLSGHAGTFPLTPEAHSLLVSYVTSSREQLADTLDADETVRDLEGALGDRLHALLGASEKAIDDRQMTEIIRDLGHVEPFSAQPARSGGGTWTRIDEGKWFGGVCVGLAVRGHLRLDWVRTIGVFLMLLTGGLIGIVYLGLWAFLPRVGAVNEYEQRTRTAHPAF